MTQIRFIAAALVVFGAAVQAADLTPQQAYQQQRAACLQGHTGQDRQTCLREAGAALAEARRGTLAAGGDAAWQRNALARCEAHQDAGERQACERMARGEGSQQGSVAEGGILYELTTRSVEPAASEPAR